MENKNFSFFDEMLKSFKDRYRKEIVDEALRNIEENFNGSIHEMHLKRLLEEKGNKKDAVNDYDDYMRYCMLSAYVYGFMDNCGKYTYDECFADYADKNYSEYRKNKNFTVFFNFGDNDFGGYLSKGAQIYADRYNSIMQMIDTYRDNPEWNQQTSSYVKDIENLENIETIKKVLAYGVVSNEIESSIEYSLMLRQFSPERDILPIDKKLPDSLSYVEYLKIYDDNRYVVGTYEEVEKQVMETSTLAEGKSLENSWFNGEVLILTVRDGEMKVWIK